jgi:hypothetical protein
MDEKYGKIALIKSFTHLPQGKYVKRQATLQLGSIKQRIIGT